MRQTILGFAILIFSHSVLAQSFTRTDFKTQDGVTQVVTSHVYVQGESLFLGLEVLDDQSGNLVWQQEKSWQIFYNEKGHIVGEREETGATMMTLVYGQEKLNEFQKDFDADEDLRASYQRAQKYENTACERGFKNYEAMAIETDRTFSTIIQAICY